VAVSAVLSKGFNGMQPVNVDKTIHSIRINESFFMAILL